MNRRTIIIILIFVFALILLGVAGVIFINSQNNSSTPQPPTDQSADGTPVSTTDGESSILEGVSDILGGDDDEGTPVLVEVVVSLQTVPRGHQMSADILTTDFRRASDVGSNVITDIEDAIGLFARTDVFQGETLTRDTLVRNPTFVGAEEFGPSSLIPPGFIAAAIPLDLIPGVANGVAVGDYVDIMTTFNLYRIDEQFQTFLENNATFFIDDFLAAEEDNPSADDDSFEVALQMDTFFVVPFGRFEELANGDLVLESPSEFQRPIPISMVLQNAKVIQVGNYVLPRPASDSLATPTPEPLAEGAETPTPEAAATATPTPPPPDVIVVALSPQQQLFLKHAVEVGADIDLALRGASDNQLFEVDQVDMQFLLEFFNIEIPPNFDFTIDTGSVENAEDSASSGGGAEGTAVPPTSPPPEGG